MLPRAREHSLRENDVEHQGLLSPGPHQSHYHQDVELSVADEDLEEELETDDEPQTMYLFELLPRLIIYFKVPLTIYCVVTMFVLLTGWSYLVFTLTLLAGFRTLNMLKGSSERTDIIQRLLFFVATTSLSVYFLWADGYFSYGLGPS